MTYLLARSTESSLASPVRCDGLLKRRPIEVGPKCLAEIQFGVGQLPKQEIADALFAAGSNE